MWIGVDNTGVDVGFRTMSTAEDVMVDVSFLKLDKGIVVAYHSIGYVSGHIAATIDIVKVERTGIAFS